MSKKILWFIPNLISTDLTKNYSRFQDFMVLKYGYEKVIITNNILNDVQCSSKIEKIVFFRTRYGYFYNFIKILKYLQKDNIFLIYDNSYWMLFFIMIVQKIIPIKVVLKLDSSLEKGHLNHKKVFLFKSVDLILYESKNSKKKLLDKKLYNIELLYNGLIEKEINYLSTNIQKEKVILFSGRITEEKQVNLLIDIFLSLNLEEWELHICGPLNSTGQKEITAYQKEFMLKIKENSKIKYFGMLSGNEYLDKFLKSKIFILPSYIEGLPNVLAYAFFSKNLVLATNVGSVKEYLTTERGILIENTDYNFIKQQLSFAVSNYEKNFIKQKIQKGHEFAMKNLHYEIQFQNIARRLLHE